ncbi:MAG: hypothetical protein P8K05_02085 [Dehalococcoidia bacterium]|nr:hypothetical protein [Dehalococcoidia bacterium]
MNRILINKLNRYIRIAKNKTGELPDYGVLMKKLELNEIQLDKLFIESEKSSSEGFDREPEVFEFSTYLKLDRNDNNDDLSLRSQTKSYDLYQEFLKYREVLDKKMPNLDFSDDDSTEDILEIAGTLHYIVFISNEELYIDDRNSEVDLLRPNEDLKINKNKYETLMKTIFHFNNNFEDLFLKIGIVFEGWDIFYKLKIEYKEQDIIKDYQKIDFNKIETILKQ